LRDRNTCSENPGGQSIRGNQGRNVLSARSFNVLSVVIH
jgi:hypothetical protein